MTAPGSECAPGYFCLKNSTSASPDGADGTGWPCHAGHYCPQGTTVQRLCPQGTFNNYTKGESVDDCENCTAGFHCPSSGLTSPKGPCSPGYYCPGGDTTADSVPCDVGHYCVSPFTDQSPCASGSYQDESARSSCKVCPAGFVCNATHGPVVNPNQYACPRGHYCPNGTKYGEEHPCPKGRFGKLGEG